MHIINWVINLYKLFLIFQIFSIFGYILECIYSSILLKKVNLDRGFFFGPYLPIYGITIVIMYKVSQSITSTFLFYIVTILLISFIEYTTGTILENAFKRKWWDYSRKKYNIKGRICLDNIIIFSISGVILSKCLIPLIDEALSKNKIFCISFGIVSMIIFFCDVFYSFIYNFQKTSRGKEKK